VNVNAHTLLTRNQTVVTIGQIHPIFEYVVTIKDKLFLYIYQLPENNNKQNKK